MITIGYEVLLSNEPSENRGLRRFFSVPRWYLFSWRSNLRLFDVLKNLVSFCLHFTISLTVVLFFILTFLSGSFLLTCKLIFDLSDFVYFFKLHFFVEDSVLIFALEDTETLTTKVNYVKSV